MLCLQLCAVVQVNKVIVVLEVPVLKATARIMAWNSVEWILITSASKGVSIKIVATTWIGLMLLRP
jgi:hypothetical protein